MVFHVIDENSQVVFTNSKHDCVECIGKYINENSKIILCPHNNESKRVGGKQHKDKRVFICDNIRAIKTSKLFKEKIEILLYSLPSILLLKNEVENKVKNEEREKYAKIVHNLKTLNAQSLLSQYKFIPQDAFSENYGNLFDFILQEVKNRPKDATVALLKQAKNNEHMKTEFSTHEKLSIDNPILFPQIHNIRKVILNVYHSFDNEFREKKVAFKIDDIDVKSKFDYETVRVALYHIFSNAVKYIASNSTLNVKFTLDEGFVFVDFIMKSFYIFTEEVENMFNDHFSGKVASSQKLNGSGLGMGLIRKALTINGASIIVKPGSDKIRINDIDYGNNIFRLSFSLIK